MMHQRILILCVLCSFLSCKEKGLDAPNDESPTLQYKLDINIIPSGAGLVTRNPANTGYSPGANVDLWAIPNAPYTFRRWFGNDGGAQPHTMINMRMDTTLSAEFEVVVPLAKIDSLIWVPDGRFYMGSLSSIDQQPIRNISISGFWMDNTEITQGEFQRIMGTNPSQCSRDAIRPVESVTWFDAVLYCNKRSKLEHKDTVYTYNGISKDTEENCIGIDGLVINISRNGYRLPTEAEWEYACRAGTESMFYWGDTLNGDYCWNHFNNEWVVRPVALKFPNAFGLFDMSGNVWEWCNDWYGRYDSTILNDPVGPYHGPGRVMRGGSYYFEEITFPSRCREFHGADYHSSDVGFRCVRR